MRRRDADTRRTADTPQPIDRITPAQRRQLRSLERESASYDEEMDFFERWITGTEHRGWACSQASGHTLEVGVGTGLNLPHYPPGLDLVGIDLSPAMLAVAAGRARHVGSGMELLQGDVGDLPFPENAFDTVLSTYTLCSVPDDAVAISEMRRVLKPGGRLILVDHVRSVIWPILWAQYLWELIPRHTKGEYMTRRPVTHVSAEDFDVVAHHRLRAGIVERLVAVKR